MILWTSSLSIEYCFSESVTNVDLLVDISSNPSPVFYNVPSNDDINNKLQPLNLPICVNACPISQCDSVTVGCAVGLFQIYIL